MQQWHRAALGVLCPRHPFSPGSADPPRLPVPGQLSACPACSLLLMYAKLLPLGKDRGCVEENGQREQDLPSVREAPCSSGRPRQGIAGPTRGT